MENRNPLEPSGRNRTYILLTITIFSAYFIFGFADSVRGPAIPRIQADLVASEFRIALLLTMNSVGYLIACSYTAALAKKISMKGCAITALLVVAVSGLFICYSPGFWALVLAFFIANLGFGMMEISLGVISAATFTKNTGTMLNLVHFFYGAGAVFSPVLSIRMMAARFGDNLLGWRYSYLIIFSFALVPALLALIVRLKKQDYDKKKTGYAVLLKKPAIWLIIVILAFGVTCEIGSVAWLVNFLEKAYFFSKERAALQLTLFFIGFTASRLIMGPIIDRIGFINSLIVATFFAGTAITAGVLLGETGAPLLVMTGIGISLVFPTMMAVTAKLFADEIDLAITAVTTAMGVIMVPANLMVGIIINQTRPVFNSLFGDAGVRLAYSAGYLFIGLCSFGAFVFLLLLRRRQKKAGQLV